MPCQNNGVCIPDEDNVHNYRCNCTKGYTGNNCETHSACESENCNGGECIAKDSNPNEFICLCPLGRVGVQCETGRLLSLLIKCPEHTDLVSVVLNGTAVLMIGMSLTTQ